MLGFNLLSHFSPVRFRSRFSATEQDNFDRLSTVEDLGFSFGTGRRNRRPRQQQDSAAAQMMVRPENEQPRQPNPPGEEEDVEDLEEQVRREQNSEEAALQANEDLSTLPRDEDGP